MNFKKIMLFFCIGFPLCTIARVLQIHFAIDFSNGFFYESYNTFGNVMTIVILAVALILSFAAFKAYKTPAHPPKNNIALSLSAGFVAFTLLCELLFQNLPLTNPAWQMASVKFVTVICIAYFFAIALQGILKIRLPAIIHVVPFFYIVAKVIFTFISISSLALISDNILLLAAFCLLMLFFINYGKLYNKLDTDLNFRKILATGLSSAIVCGAQSVAFYIINIFGSVKYLHTDTTTMLTLLAFSIFAITFTISHFRKTV